LQNKRTRGDSGTAKKKSASCFHTEERFESFMAASEREEKQASRSNAMTNSNQVEITKAIIGMLLISFGPEAVPPLGFMKSLSKENPAVKEFRKFF